jgi:hexosaminidase
VIPAPSSLVRTDGAPFVLNDDAFIGVSRPSDTNPEAVERYRVARYLERELVRRTGRSYDLGNELAAHPIHIVGAGPEHGDEGYEIRSAEAMVVIGAHQPAGMFRGVQTLLQMLTRTEAGWIVPAAEIVDRPRYRWRGLMLDVARHFFDVDTVKHVIDIAARYKINILHLHLTDDQGWRLQIDSWPKLTSVGGQTQVGGGPGGFYTKDDYAEIVAYAAERYLTVVPEIDVPGHTNAALAAYPELTCDGQGVEPFTGTKVGFSSLCLDKPITEQFLTDVFGELAEMTPGPYIHVGGDEALTLTAEEYAPFMERVQKIVAATGKQVVGWQEMASSPLVPGAIVQYWNTGAGPAQAIEAVGKGAPLIVSPANRAYLDMKYDAQTALGLEWAGHVEVRDSYEWDPPIASHVFDADIVGVEAPLWTETVTTRAEIEYLALPRLAAIAEVGWSARDRGWEQFRERLAAHAADWEAQGLNYYRSPQVWSK